MRKLVILALVVIVPVVTIVLAVKALGWWAVPIGILLLLATPFLVKWIVKRSLEKVAIGLFDMKSCVLRGAKAEIHSVARAEAPAKATEEPDDEDEKQGPREYWLVEFTVIPQADREGAMSHWEPGELRLIPPGSDPKNVTDSLGSPGEITVLQEDGTWASDDGMKFPGQQRLRVVFATDPGVRKAVLAYYFELLGDVSFPAQPAG